MAENTKKKIVLMCHDAEAKQTKNLQQHKHNKHQPNTYSTILQLPETIFNLLTESMPRKKGDNVLRDLWYQWGGKKKPKPKKPLQR